jgi:hypothetical protein
LGIPLMSVRPNFISLLQFYIDTSIASPQGVVAAFAIFGLTGF